MMKIFPIIQIKELGACTVENEPVASIDLMERISQILAKTISGCWNMETPFTVLARSESNGEDALVVSRLLAQQGYRAEVYPFNTKGSSSPDYETGKKHPTEPSGIDFHEIITQFVPPELAARHTVFDGLFGSGLNRPPNGGFATIVKYISSSPTTVVILDVPSGLVGEDNTYNIQANIIRADLTLDLQLPKLTFLLAENEQFVGEQQLLDIGLSEEVINEKETDFALTEHEDIPSMLEVRNKSVYKGNFDRALLIAGSQRMAGALVFAVCACLRSGIRLLTVHTPSCNNFTVQTFVSEVTMGIDTNDVRFSCATDTDDYQAVSIGPGLGKAGDTEATSLKQIKSCQTPMVVDADALNLLGEHRSYIGKLSKGSVLTPHPKELERLVGKCQDSYERLAKVCELAQNIDVHLILKGTYFVVIIPESKCRLNSTGNSGMTTGGSGDVPADVVLALLVQGYAMGTAVRLTAYVYDLAGDIAREKHGAMGMTTGDTVDCLPLVWCMLEEE